MPDSDSPLPLAAAASNAPVLQWHCGSADGASGRGKSLAALTAGQTAGGPLAVTARLRTDNEPDAAGEAVWA